MVRWVQVRPEFRASAIFTTQTTLLVCQSVFSGTIHLPARTDKVGFRPLDFLLDRFCTSLTASQLKQYKSMWNDVFTDMDKKSSCCRGKNQKYYFYRIHGHPEWVRKWFRTEFLSLSSLVEKSLYSHVHNYTRGYRMSELGFSTVTTVFHSTLCTGREGVGIGSVYK